MDLIEVAAQARPPVCKVGDYGRLRYQQQKRAANARKNQTKTKMKEVKVRPKTDEHDLEFKARQVRTFLEAGNKVKITVRFRGREHAHRNIGAEQCQEIFERCKDVGVVETRPHMEGRTMHMIIAPTT